MFRNLVGFAVFAVVALLAFKLLFGLFGLFLGLFISLVWLAFWGWLFYLLIKELRPTTAERIWEVIYGSEAASVLRSSAPCLFLAAHRLRRSPFRPGFGRWRRERRHPQPAPGPPQRHRRLPRLHPARRVPQIVPSHGGDGLHPPRNPGGPRDQFRIGAPPLGREQGPL